MLSCSVRIDFSYAFFHRCSFWAVSLQKSRGILSTAPLLHCGSFGCHDLLLCCILFLFSKSFSTHWEQMDYLDLNFPFCKWIKLLITSEFNLKEFLMPSHLFSRRFLHIDWFCAIKSVTTVNSHINRFSQWQYVAKCKSFEDFIHKEHWLFTKPDSPNLGLYFTHKITWLLSYKNIPHTISSFHPPADSTHFFPISNKVLHKF